MRKATLPLAAASREPRAIASRTRTSPSAKRRTAVKPSLQAMEKAASARFHEVERSFHRVFGVDDRMARYAQQSLASYHQAHAADLVGAAGSASGSNEECRPPSERKRNRQGDLQPQQTLLLSKMPPATPSRPPRTRCYDFFTNQLRSVPGNELIEELLSLGEGKNWSPATLEVRHDYIQWLFPLREVGANWSAPLLTSADAAKIREDNEAMANVLRGFCVMLRFYGMQLLLFPDQAVKSGAAPAATMTAEIRRSPNTEFQRGYANLRRSPHNYLRISRILQFLGEVGLEKLKVTWLRFLAHEVVIPARAPAEDREDCETRKDGGGDDSALVVPAAPLEPCGFSFASFWIETPYDAGDRLAVMAETLARLRGEGDANDGSQEGEAGCEFASCVSGVPVPPGTLDHAALAPPLPPTTRGARHSPLSRPKK